ncbi:MAG: cupin domain-containing protein [Chloroflexota bacterium]
MYVLSHSEIPARDGYYSKIINNRMLKTSEVGAASFCLQEQIIPPGGYIVSHSHPYEESLTFLSGRVTVTINDETAEVEAAVTIFIPPHTIHSVINQGSEPAKLIAVHGTNTPEVVYPDGTPEPVKW